MNKINLVKMSIYTALMANCFTIKPDAPCCRQDRSEKPFFIDGDYLYWKAEVDQAYYAIKAPGIPESGNDYFSATSYNLINPCFKGTSGARIKAGYYFCNDCNDIDTRISYTHLNSCNSSSVAETHGILATASSTTDGLIASEAKSRWGAKFNAIDWELGITQNDLCDFFVFRPHIGIKWAKIDQKQATTYLGLDNISTAIVNKFNCFSGAGPRMGIDSQWYFCDDISIVGNISGALLYGKFNVHSDYTTTFIKPEETLTPQIFACKKRVAPTTQMFLGLNWESSRKCTIIDMSIGYEVQYWWNQWQSIPSVIGVLFTTPGNGEFSMHGITASLGLRF